TETSSSLRYRVVPAMLMTSVSKHSPPIYVRCFCLQVIRSKTSTTFHLVHLQQAEQTNIMQPFDTSISNGCFLIFHSLSLPLILYNPRQIDRIRRNRPHPFGATDWQRVFRTTQYPFQWFNKNILAGI